MHSLRYPFIVCILFINNILIFSQQIKTESQFYQLKAIVADSLTGLPIPFGSVTLLSQPGNKFVKGTTADENGEFSFFNLASANYSIRFNSIGYNEKHYNLNFKDTNNLNQKFVLTPTQIELNDVVVQAHKPLYRQEADKKVYLVSNDPIIQSSFGLDALQNAPGVDVDLSGAISLRGTSVAIFINGQQTNKTGELLKTYLEQLPASSIERIEIISNPSAKYTATNTNGVINIILKKNSSINQLFCLGAVVSNRPTYGLWSSYVFNKPKWNLNLRYLVSSTSDHQEDLKESKSALNDYNFHSLFNQTIQNQNINQNIDADFDYKFSAKSSLTMSSGAFWSNGDNRLENSLYREFENSDSVATFNSNKEKFSFIYNNFTFNRTFNTEGHTLSISIFNEIFETNSTKLRDQRSLYSDKNQIRYTSECLSNSSQSLKIDYSLPFTKDYGMEVGFLYNPFVKTKDYRQVDTLSNNGGVRYRCDLLHKSNSTQVPKFESYLTLNGSFLKLQYKVGIRFETSNVNIKNAAPTFSMNRKFIGAYPSIHFSYETSGKHNFSISYSSRIVKPYDEMNPYIDMFEESNITQGNPQLNPARTDSYELGYFKDFNGLVVVNSSVYHRSTKNDITSINNLIYSNYYNHTVLLQSSENISNTKFSGTSTDISYQITPKIKFKINGDMFYRAYESIYNDSSVNRKSFYYTVKATTTLKVANHHQIMIVLNYKSEDYQLLNKTKDIFTTSLYTRSDFLNNKLNVAFVVRNLFIKNQSVKEYNDGSISIYAKSIYVSPIFQCSALWKFGNKSFERQANINRFIN